MLRMVHAEGGPAERGRTIGTELADLIARSLDFYRAYFDRQGVDAVRLRRLVAPYRSAACRELPALAVLLDSVAEGAEVPPEELWAVNALEELEPLIAPAPPSRCTTFTTVDPAGTILAHNEQWLAGDRGNLALVVEHGVAGEPTLVSPTVACCLPAVGLNGAGLAQGIDSLAAPDDRTGVPRVLVSRHALASASRHDAFRRAAVGGRAGGYAHVFACRGGEAFMLETSAGAVALLDGPGAHTNHYLAPDLAEAGDPPSPGSLARLARLEELLLERRPARVEDAMAILRDHASAPQAICEHAGPDGDDDASVVLFSMVCEVETGRMWVAAGNPCETPYEEVDLSDVNLAVP
jgi:isopenicillin-N N-acyltransferase like protein